jgi:aspartyl protease family protein
MAHVEPLRVVYLSVLLLALTGWIFAEYRGRLGEAMRTLLAWGMILIGVAALYGMWGDLRRDIRPVQEMTAAGTLTIPRAADGHYYPRLKIGGQEITFMADTGATGVTLTPHDAQRLGINTHRLAFVNQAMTANGVVATAEVTLKDVTLGPFHDDAIQAEVNQAEMDTSLLGMDYLGRFSVQMSGNQMVLKR